MIWSPEGWLLSVGRSLLVLLPAAADKGIAAPVGRSSRQLPCSLLISIPRCSTYSLELLLGELEGHLDWVMVHGQGRKQTVDTSSVSRRGEGQRGKAPCNLVTVEGDSVGWHKTAALEKEHMFPHLELASAF